MRHDKGICKVCDEIYWSNENKMDYDELDPGIRETVRLLRSNGFETVDSGDGRTKFMQAAAEGKEPDECALPFPNVAIKCDPDDLVKEADRLKELIETLGIPLEGVGPEISDNDAPVEIQASYDPVDGSSIILVLYLDDTKVVKERILH
jgi:hypothetical protein